MKKSNWTTIVMFVFLIISLNCSIFSASAPSTSTALPILPTLTSEPASTDTPIPSPSPTLEPTAFPVILLPQQWNGTYTYSTTGGKQNISLLIEKVNGITFTGKMIWQSFSGGRGATLKMNGEYITDFGNEVEQARWNNLEDYRNEDKDGTWLQWTETEVIVGGNYTVNGWYYAHIRGDRTMVAVYFFNDTELVADKGSIVLKLAVP